MTTKNDKKVSKTKKDAAKKAATDKDKNAKQEKQTASAATAAGGSNATLAAANGQAKDAKDAGKVSQVESDYYASMQVSKVACGAETIKEYLLSLLKSSNSSGGAAMSNASGGGGGSSDFTSVSSAKVTGDGQIAAFVGAAANELGTKESGDNDVKYAKWYGMNHQPWCAMFVSWCANKAGVGDVVGKDAMANGFMSHKGFSCQTKMPHVGDVLCWTKGESHHVGIIVWVDGDESKQTWKSLKTIEGNSGDMVCEHTMGPSKVNRQGTAWFCTPPWGNPGTCEYSSEGNSSAGTGESTY